MLRLSHVSITLALLTSSCFGKFNGDLIAEKTGDVSHPLAPREEANARQLAECGDGAPTAAGDAALRRTPFLQQVEARSALVVLATNEAADVIVDVTLPDGTTVGSIEAEADASATRGAHHQYVAELDELSPSTLYCYGVRGLTEKTGFFTAPERGPVRFAVIGDSGTGAEDQFDVRDQMLGLPFDMAVHLGDLAYEDGKPEEIQEHYFDAYGSILGQVPMFPVSGNHEYATDDARPYLEAFVLPENAGGKNRERWYSFDYGDVHFVALDTERISDEQARFLDDDLSRNTRPWTVVLAHRPPYSSGEHGGSSEFVEKFVPIIEKHRVPLVLSGHEHDYERTKTQNGVTYLVSGGGGRETREVGASSFTAFSEAVLHFLYVEVDGDRMLVHTIDGTGREFDQVLLERPRGPAAEDPAGAG